MATHATDKNRTVRETHVHVGVDAKGRHHHYATVDGTVHLIDPDTGTRETVAVDRDLPTDARVAHEYVEYVMDRCGWETINYGPHAHAVHEVTLGR